jgi:hypothetical protein
MGMLNKRTLNKARDLAMKNKDKIAAGVSKATDTIDKKTGGRHSDKLKKLDHAAAKFAGQHEGADTGPEDATDASEAPETSAGAGATDPAADEPGRNG